MKNKYKIVLVFFILMIIVNQIIVSVSISEHSSKGETINIAGKQRMYSQQITKLTLYLNDVYRGPSRIQDISNLQKTIDSFKKAEEIISEEINRLNAVITSNFSALDTIKYNKSYLESIFINLISNSLKYSSPERPPRIEVSTTINEEK